MSRILNFVINKLRHHLLPHYHSMGSLRCPVCDHAVRAFTPLSQQLRSAWKENGFDLTPTRFETLNLDAYSCPICTVSDRDRLYALYIKEQVRSAHLTTQGRFIEFAPVGALTARIRGLLKNWEYHTADLSMAGVDDRLDICDMKSVYPDNSVDMFLCSHVLEHVRDDSAALAELFRILKPGGCGILMVPVHLNLTNSREGGWPLAKRERWRLFGQDDHVRLHSKTDWINQIVSSGFRLETIKMSTFKTVSMKNHGVDPSSVLYVGHKED